MNSGLQPHHGLVVRTCHRNFEDLCISASIGVGHGDGNSHYLLLTGTELVVIGMIRVEVVTAIRIQGEAMNRARQGKRQGITGVGVCRFDPALVNR